VRTQGINTCPSAPAEPGALVLGIVAGAGEIAYMLPAATITQESLDQLIADGVDVENRMRFASTCIEDRCVQWTGQHCGLIDRVTSGTSGQSQVNILPTCGIRSSCRWFAQVGRKACSTCPDVIRKPAHANE
jgi:hypothetical protein